jgi:hypothetical protein
LTSIDYGVDEIIISVDFWSFIFGRKLSSNLIDSSELSDESNPI